jgi:hypothetical protein
MPAITLIRSRRASRSIRSVRTLQGATLPGLIEQPDHRTRRADPRQNPAICQVVHSDRYRPASSAIM